MAAIEFPRKRVLRSLLELSTRSESPRPGSVPGLRFRRPRTRQGNHSYCHARNGPAIRERHRAMSQMKTTTIIPIHSARLFLGRD